MDGVTSKIQTQLNNKVENETGNWTPSPSHGTVSTRSGYYVRVGSLVYVQGHVTFSNKPSGSGTFQISGLPFPTYGSYNRTGNFGLDAGSDGAAWLDSGNYTAVNVGIQFTSTGLRPFYQHKQNDSRDYIWNGTQFGDILGTGGDFDFSGVYRTSSSS